MIKTKRVALYLRVSTNDQTIANQRQALQEVAERRGWQIVQEYKDEGVSGAKGRDQRPGLDSMLADAKRRRFDIIMCWRLDRLGRSLIDLLGTVQLLQEYGVDLYCDKQNIDTTTSQGKLLFSITGAFAEFERDLIRERTLAGLDRARRAGKTLGRPGAGPKALEAARAMLASGAGILKTAKELGIGTGTVHKLKRAMAADA
jgi:DNA invertase Pin-like site-specific DNA recombinase